MADQPWQGREISIDAAWLQLSLHKLISIQAQVGGCERLICEWRAIGLLEPNAETIQRITVCAECFCDMKP